MINEMDSYYYYQEPNTHPFYPRLNVSHPYLPPLHILAAVASIGIYLLYVFYLIPTFELDGALNVFMLKVNTTLVFLFLLMYIILHIKKASTKEVHSTVQNEAEAIQRAEYAQANNCYNYDINYPIRYCVSCKKFVSPRTFHCNFCKCCIDLKDHHCDFFGFCIGRHNLLFFYLFFVSCFLMSLCGLLTYLQLFFYVNYRMISIWRAIKLFFMAYLILFFVFGLVVSVYFLNMAINFMKKGYTQFEEHVEGRISRIGNPTIKFKRLSFIERITVLLGINDNFC